MKSRGSTILRSLLVLVVVAVAAAFAYVWQPSIDPVQGGRASFPEEQVLRGQHVAAAGMCVVCHTTTNGPRNAGGHAMDTPFGTIYSTNITPDPETGIGNWSFKAFERAMRHGVARDGSYLYPAFPYTAFTHMNQDDMQSLYAYLMSQAPVRAKPPETDLPFPFNIRPLMAGWNFLFLDTGPVQPVADESEEWNRGNYLSRALGHCSACHSPRNQLGAEKGGSDYLAGGEAEGWHAPALNGASPAPIRWTEQALFDYLRHGYATTHGPAGASMAPVVREGTSKIPESDTRALAIYLASLNGAAQEQNETSLAQQKAISAQATLHPPQSEGAKIFGSACLACHHAGTGPRLFGVQPALWLSSSLYLDRPDNAIRYILDGVREPVSPVLGYMPAFRYSLDDRQIVALVNYMRTDFAAKPAWEDLPKTVARIREETSSKGH